MLKQTKQTLLIIEDSPDDFEVITRSVQGLIADQYKIDWCQDATEGFNYLWRRGQYSSLLYTPLPSIIILDLGLPGGSGERILDLVKAHHKMITIPTIVVTGMEDFDRLQSCYSLGANTVIPKSDLEGGKSDKIQAVLKYWMEIVTLPSSRY